MGKSAKDIAFERERAKYKKRIKELEASIEESNRLLRQKESEIDSLQVKVAEKEDWIRRLLEYTELSEEDMKSFLAKEKNMASIVNHIATSEHAFKSIWYI